MGNHNGLHKVKRKQAFKPIVAQGAAPAWFFVNTIFHPVIYSHAFKSCLKGYQKKSFFISNPQFFLTIPLRGLLVAATATKFFFILNQQPFRNHEAFRGRY
jgi:hypothetical protein